MLPGLFEMIGDSISQNKEMTLNHYYYRKAEDRANDATQRHVRDLASAGLNPMLGYSSAGSAVPASSPAPKAPPKNFSGAQHSAAQAKLANAQLGLIDSQKHQIDAMAAREGATALQIVTETEKLRKLMPFIVRTAGGEAARKEVGKELLEGFSSKERSFLDTLGDLGTEIGGKVYEILHPHEGEDRPKEHGPYYYDSGKVYKGD